jgi:hypothetical protein
MNGEAAPPAGTRVGSIDFDAAAALDFLFDPSSTETPRLSAYVPMMRAGDTAQNPTRLKNVLKDARDGLARAGLDKRDVAAITDPLERGMAGRELSEHQDDGLAIFAAAGRSLMIKCPAAFEQQVVVGEAYYVLPLLALLGEPQRFYVLAISRNRVRLIDAHRADGEETTHGIEGLPRKLTDVTGTRVEHDSLQQHSPQPGGAIFHGQGAGDDDERPELERFCKEVARTAAAELGAERRIVLAGDVRLRAMLRRAAADLRLTATDIDGNHDATPASELAASGWEIVLQASRAEDSALAERFHREVGGGRASDVEATIYEAAERGRIAVLLVDAALAASSVGGDAAAKGRAINKAVLATLQHGGTVRAVDSARMPSDARLASLFRY